MTPDLQAAHDAALARIRAEANRRRTPYQQALRQLLGQGLNIPEAKYVLRGLPMTKGAKRVVRRRLPDR